MLKQAGMFLLLLCSWFSVAQERTITIAAGRAFDGKGGVLHNVRLEVRGNSIVSIRELASSESGTADYDLRPFTVLPGWIDSHVHITWHFGPNGHFGEQNES